MDDVLQNPTVEYRNTGEIETAKPTSRVQGAVLVELKVSRREKVRRKLEEGLGPLKIDFRVRGVIAAKFGYPGNADALPLPCFSTTCFFFFSTFVVCLVCLLLLQVR